MLLSHLNPIADIRTFVSGRVRAESITKALSMSVDEWEAPT